MDCIGNLSWTVICCDQILLAKFNKIYHPSQRPRWQVDKEAIGLSRVQQCSSTCNLPQLSSMLTETSQNVSCGQLFSVIVFANKGLRKCDVNLVRD